MERRTNQLGFCLPCIAVLFAFLAFPFSQVRGQGNHEIIQKTLDEIRGQRDQSRKKIRELERQFILKSEVWKRSNQELEQVNQENKKLREENKKLEKENQKLERQLKEFRDQMRKQNKVINELEDKLERLESDSNHLIDT